MINNPDNYTCPGSYIIIKREQNALEGFLSSPRVCLGCFSLSFSNFREIVSKGYNKIITTDITLSLFQFGGSQINWLNHRICLSKPSWDLGSLPVNRSRTLRPLWSDLTWIKSKKPRKTSPVLERSLRLHTQLSISDNSTIATARIRSKKYHSGL